MENNRLADFEIEESEDVEPIEIQQDNRTVQTEIKDFPIDTVRSWVAKKRIDLQPDFQRYFVWDSAKSSRLIESILLNIPLPVIYMAEENNKTFSVVDGQQRLTSICSFINGKYPNGKDFKLEKLQVLKELNGKKFSDLDTETQTAIESFTIRVIVLKQGSNPDVKFEVFERLNLGAEKLNDQELRNSIYRGSYNNLLEKICFDNRQLQKTLRSDQPHPRMVDRQLVLRFFSFRAVSHLNYQGPMKKFLNDNMEKSRNIEVKEAEKLSSLFDKTLDIVYQLFGDNAFRRYQVGDEVDNNGYWEKNKLNVALWDTFMYTFSYYDKAQIIPCLDSIREEAIDLMSSDEKFREFISRSTDKKEAITYRYDALKKRLENIIDKPEPRNFSIKLKEKLFNADPTCSCCGQRIISIDDSEVDHIQHYWRGGKTIEDNARLTHRFCNRNRGGKN